jgi:hypothetical protein
LLVNCKFINCHEGGLYVAGNDEVHVRLSRCAFDSTTGCGVQVGKHSNAQMELEGCTFSECAVAAVSGEPGNTACVWISRCTVLKAGGEVQDAYASVLNVPNAVSEDDKKVVE